MMMLVLNCQARKRRKSQVLIHLIFPQRTYPEGDIIPGGKTQDERDEMANENDEDKTTTVLAHTLGKSMPTIEI